MRRDNPLFPAKVPRILASIAAKTGFVGLAILDAASAQARTKPIDGVRLAQSPQPASSGDSYQDGRALLAAGDIPAAVAAFRAALVAAPQSIDALNGLAVAYDRMGRYDVSRSYYDTALAIEPDAALVLNNLGYSLYLQGRYQAAIPLLQQAMASGDGGARSSGQRVLNLIAAKMRADAAATSTAIALAEIEQPRARIEQSGSGEQRLVLAAPAPDAALVASLGDDAALVMVAQPWTAHEETALAAKQTATDRAAAAEQLASVLATTRAAMPAMFAATAMPAPAATLASAQTHAFAKTMPTAPARAAITTDTATRIADAAKARLGAVLAASIDTIVAATDAMGAAADAAARRAADSGARRPHIVIAPAELAFNDESISVDPAPAWLLASRRDPRSSDGPATARDETHDDETVLAFDSDDSDLNFFAARMRGVETAEVVPTEVAVARLEALLRRLRIA